MNRAEIEEEKREKRPVFAKLCTKTAEISELGR